MLDLGFIVPLRKIVKMVPAERQTLFFSATMPKSIKELADALLSDPVQVAVTPVATTVEQIAQSVMFISSGEKQALLERVLSEPAMQKVLVFTRTKHGADKVVKNLARAGIDAAAIHGNKSQSQRERALDAFKRGATRVLVATDIAARGIHVEAVTHVVNYELPNVPESYVHRIGRTARAGAGGVALSFCNGEERAYLKDIEKLTRTSIPVAALPEGITVGAEDSKPQRSRTRQHNRPDQQNSKPQRSRRGKHASSSAKQGKPAGRSGKSRRGPQANPGLDPKSGLPAFLTRPPRSDGERAQA
jgi:ATP-dependent RNA helicase RhlE